MTVSNSQLQTWANAPSSTKPQYTHEQIKKALAQSDELKQRNYEVYLQGSYANSTNTRVDSDIDVVIQLNSSFYYDLSQLNEAEKALFNITYSNATYHWSDFRKDILVALIKYFGISSIKPGNKSVKILGNDQLLSADVIPCLQHRKYISFNFNKYGDFVEGMKFWTIKENKEIINYPNVHRKNGENKNAIHRTDQMYKDLVRICKNIKRHLVKKANLNPKIAPSYFVECIIYNAPDGI